MTDISVAGESGRTLRTLPPYLRQGVTGGPTWKPGRRTIALIVADLILFGAVVLVYVALRDNQPEIFREGRRYLDPDLGAIGAASLAGSGLAMAGALWSARRKHRRLLIAMLSLSLLGGLGFLATKGLEYDARWRRGLFWSVRQRPTRKEWAAMKAQTAALAKPAAVRTAFVADATRGQGLFAGTCASCHGEDARGLPRLGLPLVASKFIAGKDDTGLRAFLLAGRSPTDPANTTGVAMPPRGGNPMLTEEKLADIAAYLRQLQKQVPPEVAMASTAAAAAQLAAATPARLVIHHSVAPPAVDGPEGLAPIVRRATYNTLIHQQQRRLDAFFGMYFVLTGLHGLHVVAGLVVLAWLLVRAIRGRYSGADYLPLGLGGLYWLVASAIWIVLFPLVYLVR